MASIFRRGSKWVVEWTDEHGVRRRRAGFRDKRLTQQLAARLEREVAERLAGVAAPGRGADPLGPLVDAYAADVVRRGGTRKYAATTAAQIRAVAVAAGWARLQDLSAGTLTDALGRLGAQASRTANAYRDSAVRLCNWLVTTGRLAANPLARVGRVRATTVRPRRALTPAELDRLAAAAPPHRAAAYRVAATSGLRLGELKRLEARDVDAAATRWRWRLRAAATKAGRNELLPMLPECQEVLAPLLTEAAAAGPTARVFPRAGRNDTFLQDLEAAGVPRHDAAGRVADWHSLRYLFCTQLAKTLPIQTVSRLMRHKDIKLTVKVYLDLGLADVAEQLETLPRILGPDPKKE